MKHTMRTLIVVSGALSLTMGSVANVLADANEEGEVALICYQWDHPDFANERLRVSIRKPAPVTETVPPQVEWGLTGKHIGACGDGTTPVVRGTIVAEEVEGVEGVEGTAHMGIYSIAVRGEGGSDTCRTVNWSCSAPSPVRAPDTWSCESRNEFDDYHGSSTLTKITDPEGDRLCGVFEVDLSSPAGATASGNEL